MHSLLLPSTNGDPRTLTDIFLDWPLIQPLRARQPYRAALRPSHSTDSEVASLAAVAEPAFAARDWDLAGPLCQRLSDLRPQMYSYALQAGVTCLFSPGPQQSIPSAIKYLQRAREIMPLIATPACLLGRALHRAGRPQDALPILKKSLSGPDALLAGPDDGDAVADGVM